MFEYWFHNGEGEIHHGTTHDFLEVCCQIAQHFDFEVAGTVVREILTKRSKELSFLRVIEWNFEHKWEVEHPDAGLPGNEDYDFPPIEKKIILHKRKVA